MVKPALRAVALGLAMMVAAGLRCEPARAQATLAEITSRGYVRCGVNPGLIGFGAQDADGRWSGLDVDYCRALSAAIFGDPIRTDFVPLTGTERFSALQSGKIDVLTRNSTATMARDTELGLDFPAINYFDGQGVMVRKRLGVSSVKELDGRSICVQAGTTTELNLADYFRINGMRFSAVSRATAEETFRAYDSGLCDAFTTDASGLYGLRLTAAAPEEHAVLPEIISKEPLGPAVRQSDSQWADIVRWVHMAMLNAEELGVTSANAESMLRTQNPIIGRLLGTEGDFGRPIGLGRDWAYRVIRTVGNYGEVFDRNVGSGSPLKIRRGLNALWSQGGLQYGIPIR